VPLVPATPVVPAPPPVPATPLVPAVPPPPLPPPPSGSAGVTLPQPPIPNPPMNKIDAIESVAPHTLILIHDHHRPVVSRDSSTRLDAVVGGCEPVSSAQGIGS
jgi:hypothetical protein